jgi:hypothetical protein
VNLYLKILEFGNYDGKLEFFFEEFSESESKETFIPSDL